MHLDPNELTGWLSHCQNPDLLQDFRNHVDERLRQLAAEGRKPAGASQPPPRQDPRANRPQDMQDAIAQALGNGEGGPRPQRDGVESLE